MISSATSTDRLAILRAHSARKDQRPRSVKYEAPRRARSIVVGVLVLEGFGGGAPRGHGHARQRLGGVRGLEQHAREDDRRLPHVLRLQVIEGIDARVMDS